MESEQSKDHAQVEAQADSEQRSRDELYMSMPPPLKPVARDLFEKYSGIEADQVIPHIIGIRNKAYKIRPYPGLGRFRFLFLAFTISNHPLYASTVLPRLKQSQNTFLDLGCCFGQDIRKVVYDGVPPTQLYGSDLEPEFINLGYDLFLDRGKLPTKFFVADVFDEDNGLKDLDGKLDMIHASAFFHLFKYDYQVLVGKRLVHLLKPRVGSLAFGRHLGNVKPGEYPHRRGSTIYRHDVETWKKMWEKVGVETETKWHVEATMDENLRPEMEGIAGSKGFNEKGLRLLYWSVRRLE